MELTAGVTGLKAAVENVIYSFDVAIGPLQNQGAHFRFPFLPWAAPRCYVFTGLLLTIYEPKTPVQGGGLDFANFLAMKSVHLVHAGTQRRLAIELPSN